MLEWVLEIMGTNQIKDHMIGICCYSTKHASLRSKSKDLLAQNLDNGPELWLLVNHCFNELVCYKADIIIISLKCNLFSTWYSCKKNADPALNTNHFISHSFARNSGSEIYFCFLFLFHNLLRNRKIYMHTKANVCIYTVRFIEQIKVFWKTNL